MSMYHMAYHIRMRLHLIPERTTLLLERVAAARATGAHTERWTVAVQFMIEIFYYFKNNYALDRRQCLILQ